MDYVVFSAPADLARAHTFNSRLQGLGFTGYVFDNVEQIEQACNKARHVLVCVSNNVVNDTFMRIKSCIVQSYINQKSFRLIPVYFDRKGDLTEQAHSYLYGLTSFNGFHTFSKYCDDDVKKQFHWERQRIAVAKHAC